MPLAPVNAGSPDDSGIASAAANPPPEDHHRFVSLAFCWADTVIEIDDDLRITFATGLTMTIGGMAPDQLVGRTVEELLTPDHRAELRSLLEIARQCGRVDNISIDFAGPDRAAVAVSLSVHVLPEHPGKAFLAISLSGGAEADLAGPGASGESGLLDAETFVAVARRHLSHSSGQPGRVLTLLAIPELVGLRRTLDSRAYRNLTNTIAGYLAARSVDRRAAFLGDGRYGLVHERGLDVVQLETQLLSMVAGLAGSETDAGVETASIVANEALADDTLGQVVSHAIRRFQEAADTGTTLRDLRDNLPKVASDAAEMASTFARLVETRGFHIAFQPVVASDGGEILFFEGLARIDGRKDESPYKYISYAEETGQISRFDLAMVEKAIGWLQERRRPDIRLSVNISGLSLLSPDCITRLHQILDADPNSARQLALEITECFRIADLDAMDQLIQSLRQRVHLVGLDDFSAGIDGFRMLSELEVDFVKFRPRTSVDIAESKKARALLESLTAFCAKTGVRSVATAVETAQGLTSLRGCGVEYVQGYLLGKPSPDIGSFR